jgi:hypothetical protein
MRLNRLGPMVAGSHRLEIAVDIPSMANECNGHELGFIVHDVDDSVITNPEPQVRPVPLKRASTKRAWYCP